MLEKPPCLSQNTVVFMAENPNNYTAGFGCTPFCRWGAFFQVSKFASEFVHVCLCLRYMAHFAMKRSTFSRHSTLLEALIV